MTVPSESWVERAVDRSAAVQRSRTRIANQVRLMLDAARRLIREKDDFTTQELVAEAGVALQTFYRYFASKDELLLALIGDAMTEACERWVSAASEIPGPLDRLRYFVTAPLQQFHANSHESAGIRFIVTAHWHLHRVFPAELAEAERPFVDLLRAEVESAADSGLLHPRNPNGMRGSSSNCNARFTTTTPMRRQRKTNCRRQRKTSGNSAKWRSKFLDDDRRPTRKGCQ